METLKIVIEGVLFLGAISAFRYGDEPKVLHMVLSSLCAVAFGVLVSYF